MSPTSLSKSVRLPSGRFVKLEQWERLRDKRKLVSGKIFEIAYEKRRKMVRNAVHNAFFNTLTMGPAFLRVPLEMTAAMLSFYLTVFYCYVYIVL